MALVRVQGTSKAEGIGSAVSPGTLTITFDTPPTLGNGLIVPVIGFDDRSAATRCLDNYGNTYVRAAGYTFNSIREGVAQFVCPKVVATGPSFEITVVVHTHSVASAIEVGGVGDGLAVDQFVHTGDESTAPASGVTPFGFAASEVFVVGVHASNEEQASITVETVSPVWTVEFESLITEYCAGEANSRILSGVSSTSISWTLASLASWAALVVAYRATAASTGLVRVQTTAVFQGENETLHVLPFSTLPAVGNGIILPMLAHSPIVAPPPLSVVDNQGHHFSLAVFCIGTDSPDTHVYIYYLPKLMQMGSSYSVAIAYSGLESAALTCCGIEVSGVGAGLTVEATTRFSLGELPSTGDTPASTIGEIFNVAVVGGNAVQTAITVESVSPPWVQELEELSSITTGEVSSRIRTGQVGVVQSCSWEFSVPTNWAAALASFNATGVPTSAASGRVTQHVIELLSSYDASLVGVGKWSFPWLG